MTHTATRERPIIFSGPMVRALLAGMKTQTRRIVKGLGVFVDTETGMGRPDFNEFGDGKWIWPDGTTQGCPYGVPGDRLWCKHSWYKSTQGELQAWDEFTRCIRWKTGETVEDCAPVLDYPSVAWRRKSGRYMPRWASRITLEITDVRVERLQDISEEDAKAEGVSPEMVDSGGVTPWGEGINVPDYTAGFFALWESIHGARSWAENPWVWALAFKRSEQTDRST